MNNHNAPNHRQQPTFSIVVPYKLGKAYGDRMAMMDELAASLPDRDDLEVIWVDDGSETLWQPPQCQRSVHTRVPNLPGQRYAGTARNTGLGHARGTWVLFCDSDDLVYTQALDELLDTIHKADSEPNPPEAWFGPMTSFHTSTQAPGERHLYTNSVVEHAQRTGDTGRLAHHYGPCGKIIRRKLIEEHGIRFGVWKVGEDAVFSVQVALAAGRVSYYNAPYYQIREGHESLMSVPHDDSVHGVFASHRAVQRLLKKAKRTDLRTGAEGYIRTYIGSNTRAVLAEMPRTLYEGALFHPMRRYLWRIKKALGRGKSGRKP